MGGVANTASRLYVSKDLLATMVAYRPVMYSFEFAWYCFLKLKLHVATGESFPFFGSILELVTLALVGLKRAQLHNQNDCASFWIANRTTAAWMRPS